MTDRKLLELAAKAGGFAGALDFVNTQQGRFWVSSYGYWNPLADDGDALRLAVKLGLDVCIDTPHENEPHTHVIGFLSEHTPEPFSAIEYHGDPYAATRRAIVRAAAEIGRNKND